jgi:hypothetical protein
MYAEIMDSWREDTVEMLDDVRAVLNTVERRLGQLEGRLDEKTIEDARELYENARANYDLVSRDRSYGIHNKDYADNLLEKAAEDGQASLTLLQEGT